LIPHISGSFPITDGISTWELPSKCAAEQYLPGLRLTRMPGNQSRTGKRVEEGTTKTGVAARESGERLWRPLRQERLRTQRTSDSTSIVDVVFAGNGYKRTALLNVRLPSSPMMVRFHMTPPGLGEKGNPTNFSRPNCSSLRRPGPYSAPTDCGSQWVLKNCVQSP